MLSQVNAFSALIEKMASVTSIFFITISLTN
jgi:hypothetical protein